MLPEEVPSGRAAIDALHSDPRRPEWFPDWRGAAALCVASGPSAADEPSALYLATLALWPKLKVIAVKGGIDLCDRADVIYGADLLWWLERKGHPARKCLKLSQDPRITSAKIGVDRVVSLHNLDEMLFDRPGFIGWAANSGFQAVNLAAQFGARRIILVGYDMNLERGEHWHGPHGKGHKPLNAAMVFRWRRTLDAAAPTLSGLGIDVVNATPGSSLQNFRRLSLADALNLQGTA